MVAAYVSPWVRQQHAKEKRRARAASKRMHDYHEKAAHSGPGSASASANKVHGWNPLTITSKTFDPTIKKVDIFRLKPKDHTSSSDKNRQKTQSSQSQKENISSAMQAVLNDSKVKPIFQKNERGHIKIPQSVQNIRENIEAERVIREEARERERAATALTTEAEAETAAEAEATRVEELSSAEEQTGLLSPARSSSPHSHYWGSPKAGSSRSHTPRSGVSTPTSQSSALHTPRTPRTGLHVAWDGAHTQAPQAQGKDQSTSPMDLDAIATIIGDVPPVSKLPIPVPPYPYAAGLEALPGLVNALSGLVSHLEKPGSPMYSHRPSLCSAGAEIENSLLFPGKHRRELHADTTSPPHTSPTRTSPTPLDIEKQTARVILSDKIHEHIAYSNPSACSSSSSTSLGSSSSSSSSSTTTSSSPSAPSPAPPTSMGAVRDLLLSKLQNVEKSHKQAVELLLRHPEDEDSIMGEKEESIKDTQDTPEVHTNVITTSSEVKGKISSMLNLGPGPVETDTARLERSVHHHPHPRSQVTRLPRRNVKDSSCSSNSNLGSAFSCVHAHAAETADKIGNILSFTQNAPNIPMPNVQARRYDRDPESDLRRYLQGEEVTAADGVDMNIHIHAGRKVSFASAVEMKAPCYSSTHETALRQASGAAVDSSGHMTQFDGRGVSGSGKTGNVSMRSSHGNDNAFINSCNDQLLAMREQRRQAMSHMPRISAPIDITTNFKDWKKQLEFAHELRNMAIEKKGMSFNFYLNRTTDMITHDLVAGITDEIELALNEEVSKFVTKI